jgi:subtilase family serine protease
MLVLAIPMATLLGTACTPAQHATGGSTASPTAQPPTAASLPPGSTADCDCVTSCYTPQQVQVAYGVKPLLERGIDGRGETVVLPELAVTQQYTPPGGLSDLRQDFVRFDHVFGLPTPRLRVVSTFPADVEPWQANGEEVTDAEMVHTIAPGAALTIVLVRGTSLDNAASAAAASVAALRVGMSQGGIIWPA